MREQEFREEQFLVDIKIRLVKLAIEIAEKKLLDSNVQEIYLELREEVLGIPQIPRQEREEEQKENKIVCHIFSV